MTHPTAQIIEGTDGSIRLFSPVRYEVTAIPFVGRGDCEIYNAINIKAARKLAKKLAERPELWRVIVLATAA